jgi:hypothetical protein
MSTRFHGACELALRLHRIEWQAELEGHLERNETN